jgi:cell division initiation protein
VALTPLEIRKKAFATQMRGYATKEVRGFLETVAGELEETRRERAALAEEADKLRVRVEAFEKTERLLKDTLVTAQRAAEDLRAAARTEARTIEERARLEAEKLDQSLRELKQKRALLLDEIRGIAQTYLALTDRLERESGKDAERANQGKRRGDPE